MKSWFQDNDKEMNLICNEEKSVFPERIIKSSKKKFTNT